MIYAEPNLNGNSKQDFARATIQLDQAILDMQEALAVVRHNVLHGRNYQHLPESETRREHDDAILARATLGLSKLEKLARDIEAKAVV